MVKGTIGGTTTTYIGNYFEWTGSTGTMKRYYYAGSTRVAMRKGSTLYYLLGDQLGSLAITATSTGTKSAETRYYPWGTKRYNYGTNQTSFHPSLRSGQDLRFTGQRLEDYIKLYWYDSRWYDTYLNRWIQPDSIIPDSYNSQSYDRYQYAYSNPVRYTDSSGHCIDGITTWACIVFFGGLLLKAIDYGWTAYDAYQSGKVLADPDASREDKLLAGLNIGLAALFEAAEPDDLLPVGLPLDDAARWAVMKGAKEAFEEGGEEALEKFLRDNLGDYADDDIEKMDLGQVVDPNHLDHIFNNPKHHLDNLIEAFDGNQQSAYNAVWREFSKVADNYTAVELTKGIQITINGITLTVRGVVVEGVVKIGTFFIP